MTDATASPDLAAIKQRQQVTWASGDYHMIGTQILIVSELLIEVSFTLGLPTRVPRW